MSVDPRETALLEAALGYVARGWHVFPVAPGAKVPLLSREDGGGGHLDATIDPAQIRRWWGKCPDANIGLHPERSGLVAIDADVYKPDCGWLGFIRGRDLPATLTQRSARGGLHHFFTAAPGRRFAGRLCPGVDIKHNGYVLLEPSRFDGGIYRFETDDDPAPVPDWVPIATDMTVAPTPPSLRIATGTGPARAGLAEVEELLSWIDPDGDGYAAWIAALQAVHEATDGSAEGLALADAWSRRGAKYRVGEVAAKWPGFRPGGGVTIKSLARRAKEHGADLSDIARRHQAGTAPATREDRDWPDLSHDHLALDLGAQGWDEDARFVAHWGKWLFWTGSCWKRDDTLEHMTRVRAHLRERAQEVQTWAERKAVTLEPSAAGRLRRQADQQARSLCNKTTIAAVSDLARANPGVAVTSDCFDGNRTLLGTPGGTVDLKTGGLRAARRDDMISRLTACAPAPPGARPERWLLFLHGAGRNGKSVFLNALLDLWGDYGRRVAATTFLKSTTERHPTDIAGLHGARLAVASELPRGKVWDEATIKDLTGGDRMTARYMRQDYFDFEPQLTLMIAGNTQPSFHGIDEAIRARVVLVPFTVTIPPERRDKALPDKLKAEGPAILRWCIDGAVAWHNRGLDVPASITAASGTYFDEEDIIGQFLEDHSIDVPQQTETTDAIFEQFQFWCSRQGLNEWTKRTLIKELKARGYEDAKINGRRSLRGLKLR